MAQARGAVVKAAKNKITELRHDEASKILFNEVIRIANNRKSRNHEITDFFKVS